MTSKVIERSIKALSKFDLVVNHFTLSLDDRQEDQPFLELNRTSYPGFEAHLFTIADASLWLPDLTSESDVVLYGPKNDLNRYESWLKFLAITQQVMNLLKQYRQGLKHRIYPSTHWISHETKWYRKNWENPRNKTKPVDEFLDSVDDSIKSHIFELNSLGFPTTQCCSGLAKDHVSRDAYQPYVMFDERIYPRSNAHLFTLANIAGWMPSYGPHNFDIEFKLQNEKNIEQSWDNLVESARRLEELLQDYRNSFK